MQSNWKNRFTAKRLAFMAVFIALSYVVSFLEIPLPLFGASFLKLDFGNVFIVLIAFLLGPIEGVLVCLLKEGLRCLTSTSMCAGELANFLITSSYLLLPSILYQYRRTLKTVIWTLSVSCVLAIGAGLLSNRFIIFPTYAYLFGGTIFGMTVTEAFSAFWVAILLFNLIKTVAVGVLTMLLYKRLSNFLKKIKIQGNSRQTIAKSSKRYYNKRKRIAWNQTVNPVVAWSVLGGTLLLMVALMLLFWL